MMERTITRWHCVSDETLLKIGKVASRLDYYLQQYTNLEMQIKNEIEYMEIEEDDNDNVEEIDLIKKFLRNSMSTIEQRDLYALALKLKSLLKNNK
ncbi:ets [Palpita vitrealis nucleopolyhedrovirus]|uniref:Ets n=1 Tax=Palpita vitrealis nucleopolyhedrovirus TaxID=2951960 RepID=A0AAE9LNG1_9ABAC|nr:ets [Palpita vitrealis nucleopolyhedrovirus]